MEKYEEKEKEEKEKDTYFYFSVTWIINYVTSKEKEEKEQSHPSLSYITSRQVKCDTWTSNE